MISRESPSSVREAYPRWAGLYRGETVVTTLEDRGVRDLGLDLDGRDLLDAGCGLGRRLAGALARRCVGIDVVPQMLTAGRAVWPHLHVAAGDLRDLPFADRTFDVVWCRLAIGHVPDLACAYRELARVTTPGGDLVVTDFHPDAVRAGHSRSFRDEEGNRVEVEHHRHDPADHVAVAERHGLALVERRDLPVGPPVRALYEAAGAAERYAQQEGLSLVLLLRFTRKR